MAADRLFRLFLRAYPRRIREQFGDGMRYAWRTERDAARARGPAALVAFWIGAAADTMRFAAAQHAAGVSPRALFAVDWRDAWRGLRAAPMVAIFSIVSLGLGVGGVTALFSILNSLSLKPLPAREPGRLAILVDDSWTNPIWESVRGRQHQFADGAFAWATDRFNLSPTAAVDRVEGLWVSGSFFEVLGVATPLGRPIGVADDVRGGGPAGPVAVISHRMWQRRFGGSPGAIGQRLLIERVPFTIVGVTPEGFFGPDVGRTFDVAIPLGSEPLVRPRDSALDARTSWWLNIMVRLKPGQSAEQATAALRALQPQIRNETLPAAEPGFELSHYLSDPFTLVAAPGGRSPLRGRYEQPLRAILGVAAMVLLIACANIANLLIARASSRRHELALRIALGASRWRIARQLIAESLMVSAAGGAVGLAVAQVGSRALVARLSTMTSAVDLDLAFDWRVLGFTAGVSLLATLLFGVAPALTANRIAPNDALKERGRELSMDRRFGVRHASTILQVACSLTLVVAAGLFTRTLRALDARDVGFDRHGVLVVSASVDRNPIPASARGALFERFREVAAAMPGVTSAAISYTTPIARAGRNTMIRVPAGSPLTRRERMSWVNLVSPDWFATFGLRLYAGRDFTAADRLGSPPVAIVNRAFAARFLAGKEPIGATFTTIGPGPAAGNPAYQVVGVVEDSVYRSLRSPMEPTMFAPLAQEEEMSGTAALGVRAASMPPESLVHGLAAALERVDPSAIFSFVTLERQVDDAMSQERLLATLATFFGILGLLLAAVGLYGVTSYAVTSRRAEIGIRMALGANAAGVVRLVLIRTAWLVGIGVALGAGLSAWSATLVRTLLYGLEPRDPLTFSAAASLLIVVAGAAAWLPARHASRIDPVRALRD